ncbi:MAG: PepSY-associated TM helix domain-containing protein, partial [Candidatus Solibacter sp.]|nr:PepSY-associated TM helix domain-containing protein [Candidatus Solibacter sp.]
MSVRTVFLKLHLWVGLGAALLVALLAATGTMLVYDGEIDRMLNPKLLTVAPQPQNLPLTEIVNRVRQQFKGYAVVNLGMNPRPDLAWQVILGGKGVVFAYVNPHTGQVTGSRARDASFIFKVHQLHTNLLLGKKAQIWVGYGNACLMFLLITGVVLWWKRKMLAVEMAGS